MALIPSLRAQGVLSAHPLPVLGTKMHSGCNVDEAYTYADHVYTVDDVDSILSRYARIARQESWKPIDEISIDHHCYGKRIGTANAFLLVWIESAKSYSVTINATHGQVPPDGGLLC